MSHKALSWRGPRRGDFAIGEHDKERGTQEKVARAFCETLPVVCAMLHQGDWVVHHIIELGSGFDLVQEKRCQTPRGGKPVARMDCGDKFEGYDWQLFQLARSKEREHKNWNWNTEECVFQRLDCIASVFSMCS